MKLLDLQRLWRGYFFLADSALPIAGFRIAYGLLVLGWLFLLQNEFLTWFGTDGLLSTSSAQALSHNFLFSTLAPALDDTIYSGILIAVALFAVMLTIGYLTRLSAAVVYIGLLLFSLRNPAVIPSCYSLLLAGAFYLIFSQADKELSIDRFRSKSNRRKWNPWAQRLFQLQICIIYIQLLWIHLGSSSWQDGSIFYYLTQLSSLAHHSFQLPPEKLWLSKFISWSMMLIEFSACTLIWIKEFRYPVILLVLIMNIFLDYVFNVPVFYWLLAASMLLFVDGKDLRDLLNKLPLLSRKQKVSSSSS
jgi:hypothetical protein